MLSKTFPQALGGDPREDRGGRAPVGCRAKGPPPQPTRLNRLWFRCRRRISSVANVPLNLLVVEDPGGRPLQEMPAPARVLRGLLMRST